MLGDDPTEEIVEADKARSFLTQSLSKKVAIVVAGPLFNFILAFFVFWGIFMAGIPMIAPEVGEVQDASPAMLGGIKPGDRVISINDKKIEHWEELREIVQEGNGSPVRFLVSRTGKEITLTIVPMKKETKNIFGEDQGVWIIGARFASSSSPVKREKKGARFTK